MFVTKAAPVVRQKIRRTAIWSCPFNLNQLTNFAANSPMTGAVHMHIDNSRNATDPRWRRLIVGCSLLLVSSHAMAFVGCEHEILGNLSVEIAHEYSVFVLSSEALSDQLSSKQKSRFVTASDTLKMLQNSNLLTNNDLETYGGINKAVDYVLYPLKILEAWSSEKTKGNLPTESAELNLDFAENSRKARSAHVNDAHFQGHLLNSYVRHHRSAVLEAHYVGGSDDTEVEKQLFGAFVLNALADHYLQDFFAPGHIVTPRENFHDSFAMGWHDHYNRKGVSFELTENWIETAGIGQFCKKENIGCLEHHVDNLLTRRFGVSTKLPKSVHLHGDGGLFDCDRNDAEQVATIRNGRYEQLKLMLIAQAQSILDVISSFVFSQSRPVMKLKAVEFKPPTVQVFKNKQAKFRKHIAQTDFGKYSFDNPNFRAKWGPTYPAAWKQYDTVFGVNAGFQTIDSDEDNIRAEAGFEVVPFGIPGAMNILRDHDTGKSLARLNWAPIVPGVRIVGDTSHYGVGPSVRTILAWPRINAQLSVTGFYTHYSGSDLQSAWKPGWNIRTDIGFSLLTAYIGLGQDFAPNNGRLDDGVVMSAGVQFTAPWRRLPLISRLNWND